MSLNVTHLCKSSNDTYNILHIATEAAKDRRILITGVRPQLEFSVTVFHLYKC